MASVTVELKPEELALLVGMLEAGLDETRVELHRTHFSPAFREGVKDEAKLLRELLDRFRGILQGMPKTPE